MISYTITVCNEDREIQNLLSFLKDRIRPGDEIIIQMDSTATTSNVKNIINSFRKIINNMNVIEFPLDRDFAKFKNNLKLHCGKKWIFNIDADEIPSENLIESLPEILIQNNELDMILVPRWNTVDGITQQHIQKWGWDFDKENRVNWPDYQTRIYKNNENIYWKNKVHERLTGYGVYSNLPEDSDYCLFHTKSIDKQEKQNDFYTQII